MYSLTMWGVAITRRFDKLEVRFPSNITRDRLALLFEKIRSEYPVGEIREMGETFAVFDCEDMWPIKATELTITN